MKKKQALVLLLGLTINFSFAQQKVIDSLEQQLVKPTNGINKKINLIHLGYYYQYSNPKKGLTRLEEAVNLAIQENDSTRLAEAYSYMGGCNFVLGQDSLAFALYDKVTNIYQSLGSTVILSKHFFNTASLYSQRRKHKKAIELFEKSLKLFTSQKDTLLKGYATLQLGKEEMRLGNYKTSMSYLLDGKLILSESKYKETIYYADLQATLGTLNLRLDKNDIALKNYEESLSIYKKQGIKYQQASQYMNIGGVFNKNGEYSKALESFLLALNIHKESNNIGLIASSFGSIGEVYISLNNDNLAMKYLDSAIISNKKIENFGLLSQNLNNKASIYLKDNGYLKAREIFKTALSYAKVVGDKRIIQLINTSLAKANFELKNYKEAYKNLEEARKLKDSLLSDDKKEELAVLKATYEFDKEKAIQAAAFKKNKALQQATINQEVYKRNLSIVVGAFLLLFFFVGFVIWRKKQKADDIAKQADYNAQLSALKLQSLRSQMNPHFIFNTLNSINDYILKNEKQSASNYLAKFANITRKILENTEQEEVSLSEEIEFLSNYITLEQQRLQHNFIFTIQADSDINSEITLLPPSILQPFIENSIWHGLSSKENGELTINFSKTKENLVCNILDNGVGLPKQNNTTTRKSFGLENVKNRLNLLNKAKNTNAHFKIYDNKKEGVTVEVVLPLIIDA